MATTSHGRRGMSAAVRLGAVLDRWATHAANHRTCVGFGVVLASAHLLLAAQRVYQYRHYNAWVVTARASGQILHFDCALVVLMVLRRSIGWLRQKRMDWLLPLDRHVYFHKLIGWLICVFSLLHTIAHVVNYGIVSRSKGTALMDHLFDHTAGWIPGWVSPTGFALLAILLVMGIFSHRFVRKSGRFELFYWTHLLYLPFFLLLILHGGNVWKWLLVPLVFFGLETIYRIAFVCSDHGRARVSSLQLLPNQVVRLKIERPPEFEFQAGDYVYVNIPQVARFEWHPFTISSAPEEEEYLTLHIRVAGGWTGRLYAICQEDAIRLERQKSRYRIAAVAVTKDPGNSKLIMPGQFIVEPVGASDIEEPSDSLSSSGEDNPAFDGHQSEPVASLDSSSSSSTTSVDITSRISELLRLEMPIVLDGPYSGSSARAWRCRHALFIAGGIGVTPFASLLQSLVSRYQSSMAACPHCHKACCTNVPPSLGKLRHVDFMWINRDLLSFQWFLELLLDLDREQAVRGSVMSKFLDIQLYQTGITKSVLALAAADQQHLVCAKCLAGIGLGGGNSSPTPSTSSTSSKAQPSSSEDEDKPLEAASGSSTNKIVANPNGRCPYCTIRQMQHLLRYGRPVWDEVFREVAVRSGGHVTVFYCGPAAMARVVMLHCRKFGFTFTKEIS